MLDIMRNYWYSLLRMRQKKRRARFNVPPNTL